MFDKNRLTQKGEGHDWRDLTDEEIKKANNIDHRTDLPGSLPDNFKKRYCERCGSYAPDYLDYGKIPFTCNLALVNNIHEE
jgi:RNase P subunit RPR2